MTQDQQEARPPADWDPPYLVLYLDVHSIFVYLQHLRPLGLNAYQYRQKFLRSYPFQPEVIDVLYHRWGSLPNFHRTRGVLRLLSMVVHSLIGKDVPFIRLADFDLSVKELRDELLSIIGDERYYSVLDADIIHSASGAKKIDRMLGKSYEHYSIGTRVATVIFMHSFSGGVNGATTQEIKLSCADLKYSSSIVGDAILYLKENLLYLHYHNGRYFFSLKPNLNKLMVDEMNNISDEQIKELERELLRGQLKGRYFKIYLWPSKPSDVPDSDPSLKLVVLREYDKDKVLQILQSYGDSKRVRKNTLIFLVSREIERANFNRFARKYLAWRVINDKASKGILDLREEQENDVRENLRRTKEDVIQKIAELYRLVLIPKHGGYEEIDLGMKPVGVKKTIEEIVYEKLKDEGILLEKMAPIVIEMKYLNDQNYLSTKLLYESFLNTPGMPLLRSKTVLIDAIKQGVEEGYFGLGYNIGNEVICKYLGDKPTVTLYENEVIIRKDYCEILRSKKEEKSKIKPMKEDIIKEAPSELIAEKPSVKESSQTALISTEAKSKEVMIRKERRYVHLQLIMGPGTGGLRDIVRALNLLKSKFNRVIIEIKAEEGNISHMEYEKILEAFRQLEIDVEELEKE